MATAAVCWVCGHCGDDSKLCSFCRRCETFAHSYCLPNSDLSSCRRCKRSRAQEPDVQIRDGRNAVASGPVRDGSNAVASGPIREGGEEGSGSRFVEAAQGWNQQLEKQDEKQDERRAEQPGFQGKRSDLHDKHNRQHDICNGQLENSTRQHDNRVGQQESNLWQHDNHLGQHNNQLGQHDNHIGQHGNYLRQHEKNLRRLDNHTGQHENNLGQHDNRNGQARGHESVPASLGHFFWRGSLHIQPLDKTQSPTQVFVQAFMSQCASSKAADLAYDVFYSSAGHLYATQHKRLHPGAWPPSFKLESNSLGDVHAAVLLTTRADDDEADEFVQTMADLDLMLEICTSPTLRLCIYSSQLFSAFPKKWNGKLFLWCVFRERKEPSAAAESPADTANAVSYQATKTTPKPVNNDDATYLPPGFETLAIPLLVPPQRSFISSPKVNSSHNKEADLSFPPGFRSFG